MTGTVTLTLEDYHALKDAAPNVIKEKKDLLRAAKELEVFLTYLITRENIDEHLQEFNSYSTSCKVRIVDGHAKIELTNLTQDEED